RRRRPQPLAVRCSATRASPSRSCTSSGRNGTRTTGAGARRSASAAKLPSSCAATRWKSARLRRSDSSGDAGARTASASGTAGPPKSGCSRLTTSSATSMSASARRAAKNDASSTASRRGEVTSANAVSGALSSSRTDAARSRNPASMPSNASKNVMTSETTSVPTTRDTVRRNACVAALTARRYARVGMISSRKMRLSRNRVNRFGASRKSSACRVGGVSTTMRSNRPLSWSSYSFSMAMYSCVPDKALEMLRYRRLSRMDRACSSVAAYRCTRSSNVPLVSSMSAHSSPGQSPSMRVGVLPNAPMPRASASRLAGSTVTTHARRPMRAPSRARAAAIVVLPTPPVPVVTTMERSATSARGATVLPARRRCAEVADRLGHGAGQDLEPIGADAVGEEVGQVELGQREGGRQCVRFARRQRGAVSARGLDGVDIEPGEGRVQAVDDAGPELDPDAFFEGERGLDQFVDRGLLRQGDEHDLRARRVGDEVHDVLRLAADGAGPHGVQQAVGALEERDGVPGGRGVDHDHVRDLVAFELLDLAEDEDVLDAGHGGGDDVHQAGPGEALRDAAHPVGVEVLDEGVVRCQRPGTDTARAQGVAGGDELELVVGQRVVHPEQRREPAPPLELDDERRQPGQRGDTGEDGADRGFADAPLPGDDEDPGGQEKRPWVQPSLPLNRRMTAPNLPQTCPGHTGPPSP